MGRGGEQPCVACRYARLVEVARPRSGLPGETRWRFFLKEKRLSIANAILYTYLFHPGVGATVDDYPRERFGLVVGGLQSFAKGGLVRVARLLNGSCSHTIAKPPLLLHHH